MVRDGVGWWQLRELRVWHADGRGSNGGRGYTWVLPLGDVQILRRRRKVKKLAPLTRQQALGGAQLPHEVLAHVPTPVTSEGYERARPKRGTVESAAGMPHKAGAGRYDAQSHRLRGSDAAAVTTWRCRRCGGCYCSSGHTDSRALAARSRPASSPPMRASKTPKWWSRNRAAPARLRGKRDDPLPRQTRSPSNSGPEVVAGRCAREVKHSTPNRRGNKGFGGTGGGLRVKHPSTGYDAQAAKIHFTEVHFLRQLRSACRRARHRRNGRRRGPPSSHARRVPGASMPWRPTAA